MIPSDTRSHESHKLSLELQILVRSKKLFRTYSSSQLRGAGRAVESVFILLSLCLKLAPLSLLMNKLSFEKQSHVASALCEFSY